MKLKEWLEMNPRDRPIFDNLTDEFVEMCEKEPNNVMFRIAKLAGLPEGVNPVDKRILELFEVEDDSKRSS